jgi:hypothetical protein
MNKLTLGIAALALIAIPVSVGATNYENVTTTTDGHTVVKTVETHTYESQTTTGRLVHKPKPGDYTLRNGNVLRVTEGSKTARFVNSNGGTFYAPTGDYKTVDGETFFIRDGAIRGFLFSSTTPTVVYETDVDVEKDGKHIQIHERKERILKR